MCCSLSEEYLLAESPDPDQKIQLGYRSDLQQRFLGVWAEKQLLGTGQHQVPIIIQLTSSATSIQIKQYPTTLKTKREIAVYIA